jgi:WD40 repeat protein
MLPPNFTVRDRYRIVQPIDERPDGALYRAHDTQNDRAVLVGTLPHYETHADDIDMLTRQLASVRHEGLLPLTDHFADGSTYYLVCDDPGGRDLERVLRARGGKLAEQATLEQARKLLNTVEFLHNQRPPFFLGELWASDVWVNDAGDWLLVPFTMARPIDQAPTPYRAPELLSSDVEPGRASDTYAISALLYHVLTGAVPPTAQQQQAGTLLPAPRVLNPEISTLAEQALLRGMQIKQQNRYQTVRELRLALETVQMMAGRPLGMISADAPPPNQTAVPQGAINPTPAPEPIPPTGFQPSPTQTVAPQAAAPGQPMPAPQAAAPAAPRRGLSTGCIVALVVALLVFVALLCFALAAVFLYSRSIVGMPSAPVAVATSAPQHVQPTTGAQPATGGQTTLPPPHLGPKAITIQNAAQITVTDTITSSAVGPATFSPDGSMIAIAIGNAISMRPVQTMQEAHRLDGHSGDISSVVWSPNGALLASGAQDDNSVRLWNANTGQPVHTFEGHKGWIRSLAFSPDSTLLASGSTDKSIVIWNVVNGQARQMTGHTDYIGGVAWSPDGSMLASTSRDGTVRVWDVATGQPHAGFTFHAPQNPSTNQPYWTTGVAWSPDGKNIAVGATDGIVRLLDAGSGRQQRELRGHSNWIIIRGIAYTPDGKNLISEDLDGAIFQWDAASGTKTAQFDGLHLSAGGMALSADGKQLVSTSSEEGVLLLWDVADPSQSPHSLRLGQGIITSLRYTNDGGTLAMAGYNGIMRVADLATKQSQLLVGAASASEPLAPLPNNRFVVISDQGNVVIAGSASQAQTLAGLTGQPTSVAATPDGRVIVAGSSDGTIAIWHDQAVTASSTISSGLQIIVSLQVSDDGTMIVAAGPSSDPRIIVFDVASGKPIQTWDQARATTSVALQSHTSQVAASDGQGAVHVWDARTGAQRQSWTPTSERGPFTSAAWSPDGVLLAAGTLSGDMVFFNADSGQEVGHVALPQGGVVTLAFSADGQQLAASSNSDAVYIFKLP